MNTELTDYHADVIRNSDCLIADLDGTFVKGRITYSSFYLLKKLVEEGRGIDAIRGLVDGMRIYLKTPIVKITSNDWEAENWGLRELHKVLEYSEINAEEIRESAKKYLDQRQIKGAKDCFDVIRDFGKKKKTLLVTRAPYPWSSEASHYLNFDDYISNSIKFKDNKVDEIQIIMEKPEDKFRLIKENTGSIGKSVMITNNTEDLDLKQELALLISSPVSKEKLKNESNIHISDYKKFSRCLLEKQ